MLAVRKWGTLSVAAAALTLGMALQQPLSAQVGGAKAPAKFRGRLPTYYSQVVSAPQRASIYKIQMTYAERIEALQTQLDQLKELQQAEVRAVLTPDQQKKVDELTAAAKMRRAGQADLADAPDAQKAAVAVPGKGAK